MFYKKHCYGCCKGHCMLCSIAGMPKRIVNAKIACLDFSLQKTKMKLGVQVVITDPEKLDQIRQRYVEQFIFDLGKGCL